MTELLGVDVSSHQSMETLKSWLPKVDFVFAKSTEGKTYTDPNYASRRDTIRAAGKLFGAYHFARPDNNSAADEAKNFLMVSQLKPGEVPVLDFEPYKSGSPGYNSDPNIWPEWVVAWMAIVKKELNVTPWIYLNLDIARQLTRYATEDQLNLIHTMPLWIADYEGFIDPGNGWDRWTAHQWTDSPIDQNKFNGDKTAWELLAIPKEKKPVTDIPTPPVPKPYDGVRTWDLLAQVGFPRSTTGCRQFQAAYNFDGGLVVDGDPGPKTRAALIKSLTRRTLKKGDMSENFSFAELACRCGGKYKDCRRFLATRKVLRALEAYREALGKPVTIVSGYRCPQYNATIPNAASKSNHMEGIAVDINGEMTLKQIKELRRFTGIGLNRAGKAVHVDLRDGSTTSPVTWVYNW